MIQLALQRGYLNQGQVQAALQTQAQLRQQGQQAALLPLLRGALHPSHVQELSEAYRQASDAYTVATSAATIQLPPGAVSQALANSSASFAPVSPGSPLVSPTPDPYASSPGSRGGALASGPHPAAPAQAAQATPTSLGRFEIQREIARGGMGVVYVGRDPNLDRQVAIKCLLPGGNVHPEQVERFRREGLAVARLKHPNIVQVYEVAEHEGAWYMVMDLVTGGSLMDRLKAQGPLEPLEAAGMIRDLARATACAHEHNVLHRDIKPHNVLLSADGTAKLTDFGLAKLEDVPSAEPQPAVKQDHTAYQAVEIGLAGGASLTQGGQILGTPGYLPPEQAEGDKSRVDTRSDIYSLGATLFALLAGRPPFTGDTILKVLQQLLNQPAPPVRQFRQVDRELEQIVARCLERDPGDRYPDAAALADALDAWLERQGTRSSGARRLGPSASQTRRGAQNPMASSHRRRGGVRAGTSGRSLKQATSGRRARSSGGSNAPLAIGAAAIAVSGVALFLLFGRGDRPAPPPSGSPQVAASPTPAQTPAFQQTPRYNDPPPPPDEPETPAPSETPADDVETPTDSEPPADEPPDDAPLVLPAIDEPYTPRGGSDGDDLDGDDDDDLDDDLRDDPGAPIDVGQALAEAKRLSGAGQEEEALAVLDRAIEQQPENARLFLRRAQINGRLSEYFAALSDAQQALTLKPDWPQALYVRGMASHELGHVEDAIRDLERVTQIAKPRLAKQAEQLLRQWGPAPARSPTPRQPPPNTGGQGHDAAHRHLGQAQQLIQQNRLPEALTQTEAAVAAFPNCDAALGMRGQLRAATQGDIAGGLADTNRAIELQPQNPNHHFSRAQVYAMGNDYARARADAQTARQLAAQQNVTQLVAAIDDFLRQIQGR